MVSEENEDKVLAYEKLREEILACDRCPELVKSRQMYPWGKPVPGAGNVDAVIMFVGEAPGKWGAGTTGVPFTKDRSGKFFEQLLNDVVGLRREDVYITNVVKCCPENNRTPTKDEVERCLPWLKKEIELVDPALIVIMGKTAHDAFIKTYRLLWGMRLKRSELFGDHVGHFYILDRWYYVTYHPAYYLRSGKVNLAIQHFKNIAAFYNAYKKCADVFIKQYSSMAYMNSEFISLLKKQTDCFKEVGFSEV